MARLNKASELRMVAHDSSYSLSTS